METVMFAKRLSGSLMAVALCIVASIAFAQKATEPDLPVTDKAIKAFANAPIALREAIEIAEKRLQGSKAVDVSFDEQNDRLAYKVKTFQHNEVWDGSIDASSGKISGEGTTTHVSRLGPEDAAELVGMQKAGIDLSQAVAIAEQHESGKAISAGLEEVNGRIVYEVNIVVDGQSKKVLLDIKDGSIR
jgi:uncharacterized membrane protein YkoI